MNFKSNPKRKPGKNRPASSPRLIQGPQLRDFTKESLRFLPGASKLICAQGLGCPRSTAIYFGKLNAPKKGKTRGCCGSTQAGIVALRRSWSEIFLRKTGSEAKKKNPPPDRPLSDLHERGFCTADSSEPAPSPRPWIFASGATPVRMRHHVTFTLALQSSSKVKTNTVPDEFIWPVLKVTPYGRF
jgi:hypothetical protein